MSESITPHMDWANPDQGSAIKLFKQQCELYFSVKEVKKEKQVDHILLFTGANGIRMFNSWGLGEAEGKDPEVVWNKLISHIQPRENFRVARLYLQKLRQHESESVDEFVSRLKLQAFKCSLRDDKEFEDRVIEQLIAGTYHGELQKQLLAMDDSLNLAKAIDIGRTHKATLLHIKELAQVQHEEALVHEVRREETCGNCGRFHPRSPRDKCPAFGKTCHRCKKRNHWEKMCRSKLVNGPTKDQFSSRSRSKYTRRKNNERREVHDIREEDTDEDDLFEEMTVNTIKISDISAGGESHSKSRDEAYTYIKVKCSKRVRANLKVKIDTSAQGNTLPMRMFREMYPGKVDTAGVPRRNAVQNRHVILTAYNGTKIPQYGAIRLQCRYDGCKWISTDFYIVDSEGPAILGLPSSLDHKLVTLNCKIRESKAGDNSRESKLSDNGRYVNTVGDLMAAYPEQFDKMGKLPGEYHIVLERGSQPVIHAPRKCPIHLKDELKQELDDMEQKGVIKKMTEPTDWVSSIVISRRKNGKLRVCLDPKDLNKAIKRCHHKTPTLEEITHKFAGSRYFSKLDAKNGYWSVVLDEESSRLTTFNSPFGRYCFLRMPFGLVMSQDVFQHRMDQILEKCPGTVSIADDIAVCGKTEAEHDQNLHNLMEVAKQHGLVFNSGKSELKVSQIKFFGMMYDKDGVHPDPAKVKDIKSRCSPESKTELQEFLGMVTYMSPFIPKLAEHTANLRNLLKKGIDYVWSESHEREFRKIKGLICQETTLTYFSVGEETVIQVVASSRGLGAVLLQNNKPIAFASKSLSSTEQ